MVLIENIKNEIPIMENSQKAHSVMMQALIVNEVVTGKVKVV